MPAADAGFSPDVLYFGYADAGFVAGARRAVAAKVTLPAGTRLAWSRQFEHLHRAKSRLLLIVPVTLLLNLLLLYQNFRRWPETLIVMLTLPFACFTSTMPLLPPAQNWSRPSSLAPSTASGRKL
jgi:Cu/Ag efflux pump CusA